MLSKKLQIRQPTCPWWFLFTFDNPLRKLYQDPEQILDPYLQDGNTAVDLGCGMGYFTLPMARLVGESGKVIAVDLQGRMLEGLKRRAAKARLLDRIRLHQCSQDLIGINIQVDFALAFWMVHEVHDSQLFLEQVSDFLRPGGKLLISEPYIHVSGDSFLEICAELGAVGLREICSPKIGFSRSILVEKR